MMIVITGAAGFIGSCLVARLNQLGFYDLVLVDDFSLVHKIPNLQHKKYFKKICRTKFIHWFSKNSDKIDFVYHIGARTDTIESDFSIFDKLNLNYSKDVWTICTTFNIPLIYASSAATYGNGKFGFDDNHKNIEELVPLNAYALSKHKFDKWVLQQDNHPPFWAGLKFFNVYGPNEFHKERMASVIFHTVTQIKEYGSVNLFRSHNKDYKDGEQARDFIYVKDVVDILYFMMNNQNKNGIFNIGTGRARTFLELVYIIFRSMKIEPVFSFIDTPEEIRERYQYFTQAKIDKLRILGYRRPFTELEYGVDMYIQDYLLELNYF